MATGKLAGIHYSHEAGSHGGFALTAKGSRKRCKVDLTHRAALLAESKRVSDELRAKRTDENIIASIPARVGSGRDVLAYIAEMESRVVAAREPVPANFYRETFAAEFAAQGSKAPKRATSAKTVSAAQARDIATAALSLIGMSFPRTPAEAESLLAELAVSC